MFTGTRHGHRHVFIGAIATALAAGGAVGQTASFEPLPIPEGADWTRAFGVSPDGGTIVGNAWYEDENISRAVRWRTDPGAMDVLLLKDYTAAATATSRHGETTIGIAEYALESEIWVGLSWTGSDSDFYEFGSDPNAITSDGAVVCGSVSSMVHGYAAVWTTDGKSTPLPLPEGSEFTEARDISGRGTVIVGTHGLRWTLTKDGSYSLVPQAGGVSGVSPDGSVVVGALEGTPVFWRRGGSASPLNGTIGARDCSRRGGRIIGYAGSWPNYVAKLWTPQHGTRPLQEILQNDHGLDLTGWALRIVTGISDDGTVIVGYGRNPQGAEQGWRIVLPATCTSDWNFDGVVNSTDVSDFVNEWFLEQNESTFAADVDDNGVVNSTDVSEYINAWFEDVATCG